MTQTGNWTRSILVRTSYGNATLSPLAASGEHSVDGVPEKGPEDEAKEGDEQAAKKTEEVSEDSEGPRKLSEDEREQLQYSIEQIEIDIKVCDWNTVSILKVNMNFDHKFSSVRHVNWCYFHH